MVAKILGNIALLTSLGAMALAGLMLVATLLGVDYFMYAASRLPLMMG